MGEYLPYAHATFAAGLPTMGWHLPPPKMSPKERYLYKTCVNIPPSNKHYTSNHKRQINEIICCVSAIHPHVQSLMIGRKM